MKCETVPLKTVEKIQRLSDSTAGQMDEVIRKRQLVDQVDKKINDLSSLVISLDVKIETQVQRKRKSRKSRKSKFITSYKSSYRWIKLSNIRTVTQRDI